MMRAIALCGPGPSHEVWEAWVRRSELLVGLGATILRLLTGGCVLGHSDTLWLSMPLVTFRSTATEAFLS